MWGYVLYLAFGPGRADSPDRLDDPAFAVAAAGCAATAPWTTSPSCQPASEPPMPGPGPAPSTGQRRPGGHARRPRDVPSARRRGRVSWVEWLVDWRHLPRRSRDYADQLRNDPDARLLVSPKKGQQITEFLDQFAKDNDMPACSTPGDAG